MGERPQGEVWSGPWAPVKCAGSTVLYVSSAGRGSLAVETRKGNPCSSDRSAYTANRRPRRDEAGSEKSTPEAETGGQIGGGGCVIAGAVIKII